MPEFRMPSLGADMEQGTLLEWLVRPGDVVHRGDLVATVDTSKSAIDIEVFTDGRIERLLVEPGTTVAVGTPLAVIGALEPAGTATALLAEPGAGSQAAPSAKPAKAAKTGRRAAAKAPAPASAPAPTPPPAPVVVETPPEIQPRMTHVETAGPPERAGRVAASPLARRRAHELGVDLADVHPTHPDGVLNVADVEAVARARAAQASLAAAPEVTAPSPAPTKAAPPTIEPVEVAPPAAATQQPAKADAMRAAIAALMARSKKEIPHYYLQTTVDVEPVLAWLERCNEQRSVSERIVPAAVLLKATALAAADFPDMNGFFADGVLTPAGHVHLGVAVSLRGGGLIAPALHDADQLPLPELMAEMKDLVARARAGRLRGSEMSDPTLTVTNLGEQGAELVHGVIYPPQVALVGFGRIVQRPWAVDGMLTVHRTVVLTLAADHRVSDGHRGGLFLAAIDAALHEPEQL